MVRHLSALKVFCYVLIIMNCIHTTSHIFQAKPPGDKSKLAKFLMLKHSNRRLNKHLQHYKTKVGHLHLFNKGRLFERGEDDVMATEGLLQYGENVWDGNDNRKRSQNEGIGRGNYISKYSPANVQRDAGKRDKGTGVYTIIITTQDDEKKASEHKPINKHKPGTQEKLRKENKAMKQVKQLKEEKPIKANNLIKQDRSLKEKKAMKENSPMKQDVPLGKDTYMKQEEKPVCKGKPLNEEMVVNTAYAVQENTVKEDKPTQVHITEEMSATEYNLANEENKLIEDKTAKPNDDNNQASLIKPDEVCKGLLANKHITLKSQTSALDQEGWYANPPDDLVENESSSKSTSTSSVKSDHPTLRMETLLVVDRPLVEIFETPEAARDYVLAAFTTARNLFLEPSLGHGISLVIVRMIVFDHNDVQLSLRQNRDLRGTLSAFSHFQYKVNPTHENHPNHHDMSVLITRAPLCESEDTCGIRAAAYKGGACNPQKQAAVVIDTGLTDLGHSIAHAIAIALGIEHDRKSDSKCGKSSEKSTVMLEGGSSGMVWSTASKNFLQKFLANHSGKCMEDAPAEHNIKEDELLPGVSYDGDMQCRALLGTKKTKLCSMGLSCSSLNCMVRGLGCVETNVPPAFGTSCADKSWCWRQSCLPEGERPEAVDGGWGPWSSWGPCSRHCGSGVAVAERQCNSPPPSTGGKICLGPSRRHYICNTEICPEDHPLFRDTQCAGFNDWEFPEDKQKHQWRAYFDHDESPCSLVCKNEKGDVALLKPHVADGTPCFRGSRDICVGGLCQPIPCDLNMSSPAVEDACGVCHGDGTRCKVKSGVVDLEDQPNEGSLVTVVAVSKGTRNVKVMELEPSESTIIVRSLSNATAGSRSQRVFLDGEKLGLFYVPGSEAWLGTVKPLQELLLIPGPVTEDFEIMVRPKQHGSFYYSVALDAKHRLGSYSWDFLEWNPCSATCGPGTERAVPRCMEHETGLVEAKHCSHLPKPDDKTRDCTITPCTPRWVIGDWQPCSETSDEKVCQRLRSVWCMRPMGQADDSMTLLDADECGDVGPRTAEECACKTVSKKEGNQTSEDDTDTVIVDRKLADGVFVTLLGEKTPNAKRRRIKGIEALRFLEVQCEGDGSLCEVD